MFRRSSYFFVGLLGLALLAFWPFYFNRLGQGGISVYVHFHALVMLGWFALLIVQPLLIRGGRRAVHRALGKLSFGLAPLILVAGLLLARFRLPATSDPDFAQGAVFLYLPISMMVLFGFAYSLAIIHRREAALHARYMIGTSLSVVDPIVARLATSLFHPPARTAQLFSYGLIVVALSILIFLERDQKRGRGVFPLLLAVSTVVFAGWYVLAPTAPWLAFARWFRDLPLL
jgi:hypothetical protein